MAKYKQKCIICKEKWALVNHYREKPMCKDCEQKLMQKPIKDIKFKKMFNIDQKLYEESSFLKSIRLNYARFGSLSGKQVEYFKKVVDELKNPKLKEDKK